MFLSRSMHRTVAVVSSASRQGFVLRRNYSSVKSSSRLPSLGHSNGSPSIQRAHFSAKASTPSDELPFPYLYPTRKEEPSITTTKAKDVSSTSSTTTSNNKVFDPDDPFDDTGMLSREEREQVKRQHSQQMTSVKLSSLPITTTVPNFIPSNVPSQDLDAPETLITTLENGIRVVSQDNLSQMCTFGVLTNVGSRHEDVPGTVHCLETMAFGSTQHYDGLHITHLLQDWGATRFVAHSREHTMHCIDIMRPNVYKGMNLLADVVLNPLIAELPIQVENAKEVMQFQAQQQMPEILLGEALHVAAYGTDQQLGKRHFATPETIPQLNATLVADFHQKNIRNNPKGMVIAGAGIDHKELVDMTKEHFGSLEQHSSPTTIPSTYRGGSHYIETSSTSTIYQAILPEEEPCRVALVFPVGGWHSDTLVTACVLQTLLGGGPSFSAGGPGKGMYSRIYQEVLNKYSWMDTAEACTTFLEEGGLFGLSASTKEEEKVPELVKILVNKLARLVVQPVSKIELSRARNMLKCNLLSQLESRLILFEDMGRQLLTFGKLEDAAVSCQKIDAVTADDIQHLAQDMLQNHAPTIAATGRYIDKIPSYDAVCRLFRP
jgi:mitochondrial-processing peptidase subunit alpha